MDPPPGGYPNSRARGRPWAVRTSQGQMDVLPSVFADFCSSQSQSNPEIGPKWETRQGNRVRETRVKVQSFWKRNPSVSMKAGEV